MAPAEGIARLGFKRWYERQLVEGHAYLVTCFLCMIVVAALIEEISFKDGGTRPLMMLLVLFAAGAVGIFAWGRYRVILALAEHFADRSTCAHCQAYAKFNVVSAGAAPAHADDVAQWMRVRCRKCNHEWTIE